MKLEQLTNLIETDPWNHCNFIGKLIDVIEKKCIAMVEFSKNKKKMCLYWF